METRSLLITKSCIGCGRCERICPKNSIKKQEITYAIDKDSCIFCRRCIQICPVGAILEK